MEKVNYDAKFTNIYNVWQVQAWFSFVAQTEAEA